MTTDIEILQYLHYHPLFSFNLHIFAKNKLVVDEISKRTL